MEKVRVPAASSIMELEASKRDKKATNSKAIEMASPNAMPFEVLIMY